MMSWARVAANMSPRRDWPSDVERSASSNVSSNASSDILVAAPRQTKQTTPPQQQQYQGLISAASHSHAHHPPSLMEASVAGGQLFVRFSAGLAMDRFRTIVRSIPKPVSHTPTLSQQQSIKSDLDDNGDGPNHRGTYSKEYTLLHPDIKWVHRGQGRYLPASEVKSDNPNSSPRPTRQTTERTTGSVATSERTMEKMTDALAQHFDEARRRNNPLAKENWSPSFKHHFNLILNLIRTHPRQQWPKTLELIRDSGQREIVRQWIKAMEIEYPMNNAPTNNGVNSYANDDGARPRLSRNAKTAIPSIEQRRSSRITDTSNPFYAEDDDDAGDSDDSYNQEKTFRKGYVDAHPNESFHHTGNGWYKRGSRSESDKLSGRRDSSASHAVKYSELAREVDQGLTVHAEELHNYPGMTFHHKGNRYYKPGIGPTGKRGSITVSADGQVIRPDRGRSSVQDEDEIDNSSSMIGSQANDTSGTFSKEYTLLHPEIEWVHRGGGRYRRKSEIFDAGMTTPVASSERRSSRADNSASKSYAESHVSDEFRRSSGRRRMSRTKYDAFNDEPSELFDKAYVMAHPDEEFHHRGQGRYARGTRPPRAPVSTQESVEDLEPERLYDSTYVNNHPNETFHHRGQGKWARGLPPPGSSNKTAVRGPLAKDREALMREEDEGPKPPPLTALLRKEDGPEKWPRLHWQYRGGGKWCQVSKEEATRLASGGRKPRAMPGRGRADGPEAQLQREARAAERKVSALQPPARFGRRKRNALNTAEMRSKVSSNPQSKAPTPRPPLLPPEEDKVTEEDLPSLFKEDWSDEEDDLDEAALIMHKAYRPMIGPEAFVHALTKHDPAARSLDSLKQLASNAQWALQQLQDEYLELDEIVARNPMNGKKERKAVKGGRQPMELAVWEDKKEAILYDYNFDPRKIGYQDPDAQQIVRDDEGRELRRRRNRYGHDPHATAVDYGDGEMTAKRTIKPVSRFDGVVIQPPRKRSRLANITSHDNLPTPEDKTPSATPDRGATPIALLDDMPPVATRGRWKNHVPKRVLQLRGDSVGSTRSDAGSTTTTNSDKPSTARKGRPPGSKNLHKRKDAGIKKGPRKPKVPGMFSTSAPGSVEPESAPQSASASASPEPPPPPPGLLPHHDGAAAANNVRVIPGIVENPPPPPPHHHPGDHAMMAAPETSSFAREWDVGTGRPMSF